MTDNTNSIINQQNEEACESMEDMEGENWMELIDIIKKFC